MRQARHSFISVLVTVVTPFTLTLVLRESLQSYYSGWLVLTRYAKRMALVSALGRYATGYVVS